MPHECTTCGRTFPDGSKEMLSGCPDCGGNKFQFHPGGTSSTPEAGSAPTPEASSETSRSAEAESNSTSTPESNPTSTPESDPTSTPESDSASTPTSADTSFTFGSSRSAETRDDSHEGPDADGTDAGPPSEDRAQASARSTFVSEEELPTSAPERDAPTSSGPDSDPPTSSDLESDASTEPSGSDDGGDGPTERDRDARRDRDAERDRDAGPTEVDRDTGEGAGTVEDPGGRNEPSDDPDSADISELREELNDQFESIKIHARGEYELNLMELYDREEHIIALQEDGRYVIDVPGSWREPDEDD